MTKTLRIGVLGAGRIGKVHAANLARHIPGAELACISDPRRDAASELAAQLDVHVIHDDPDHLVKSDEIDAVAICSSTDTHSSFIEKAAAAGKHIFCEKPIDYDLGRIVKALEAVKKAEVRLQIGFNRRFDPNFAAVRERIEAGGIGEPQILRITSRDPSPPPIEYVKVSGGIFLDMTIHDFDMARFLMGSDVESVFATGGALVDPEIGRAGDVDTAVIVLQFANGAVGTIDNSRKAVYGYDQRVEVFGSGGMVRSENNTPSRTEWSDGTGVHTPLPLYFFMERYMDSFRIEMKAFVDAVLKGTGTPVTGEDGLIPVVMGLAAKKSLEEKRPVALSEIR